MRVILLIFFINSIFSKGIKDTYKLENLIQKKIFENCILGTDKLREDLKLIIGDIKTSFDNHNYLEIINKIISFNPKNNQILFDCSNKILNKEDEEEKVDEEANEEEQLNEDVVLQRGGGGGGHGGGHGGSHGGSRGGSHGGSRGGSHGGSRGISHGGSRGSSHGSTRGGSHGSTRGNSHGSLSNSRGKSSTRSPNRSMGKTSNRAPMKSSNSYRSINAHIGRHSLSVNGRYGKNSQTTRNVNVGHVKTSFSKNNFKHYQGNFGVRNRNGVMKGHIGGSVTKGKTYSGRIGNLGLRGGKQNTISANAGFHASRNGLGLNGHFQKTNSYNGGLSYGRFNSRGTIGKTQTGSLNANINRKGFSVNGNYGRGVFGRGIINVGNTRIGLSGRASQNTFGGAGLNFGRNSFSAHANIGREYSAHGGLNVNGRNIANVDAYARGRAFANIGINKSGFHAQAGVNGQAKADVKIGKTQIKAGISSDLKINFDLKNGVHFGVKGGIHPNVSINRGGKTIKLLITPNEALEYIHNGKVFVTEYGIVRIRPGNKIIGQIFGNPIKRNH